MKEEGGDYSLKSPPSLSLWLTPVCVGVVGRTDKTHEAKSKGEKENGRAIGNSARGLHKEITISRCDAGGVEDAWGKESPPRCTLFPPPLPS